MELTKDQPKKKSTIKGLGKFIPKSTANCQSSPKSEHNGLSDRQADRQTNHQTDRPSDRQTDHQTDRQTDKTTTLNLLPVLRVIK